MSNDDAIVKTPANEKMRDFGTASIFFQGERKIGTYHNPPRIEGGKLTPLREPDSSHQVIPLISREEMTCVESHSNFSHLTSWNSFLPFGARPNKSHFCLLSIVHRGKEPERCRETNGECHVKHVHLCRKMSRTTANMPNIFPILIFSAE